LSSKKNNKKWKELIILLDTVVSMASASSLFKAILIKKICHPVTSFKTSAQNLSQKHTAMKKCNIGMFGEQPENYHHT
jgi:hypothetical protein